MLNGKIAVVTGAAQGIGKHAAKTLAENGASVIIANLNLETAEKAAAELSAVSEASAVAMDVRDENAVRPAMHQPLHFLKGPVEEIVRSVSVAALNDPGWVQARTVNLAFAQVTGLDHVGQDFVGAGARGSEVDVRRVAGRRLEHAGQHR